MSDSKRNHRTKKQSKYKEYKPLDTKGLMRELNAERRAKNKNQKGR